MRSWWDLGEHSGNLSSDLALYQITCAFCGEKGRFLLTYHAEKKDPNSSKTLNFDTYKCESCAGFVLVLWSASTSGGRGGLHAFRVIPYPLGSFDPPEHWPAKLGSFWAQANRALARGDFDAAVQMARSALQLALREHGAKGDKLKTEINNLAESGVLPPLMKDWSHEVRLLGNESAHPEETGEDVDSKDANDIVEFLDFLLIYLYNLPKQIQEYRDRRKEESKEEGEKHGA